MKLFKSLVVLLLILSCGQSQFAIFEKTRPEELAAKDLEQNASMDAITTMLDALGTNFENIFVGVNLGSDLNQVQEQLSAETRRLSLTQDPKKIANYVSILASAQAQLYQVDPLTLILKLVAESGSSVKSSSNPLVMLFPVLPSPTALNLQGVALAITLMHSYDERLLTVADQFKLAVFLTAYLALILKTLDPSGDGVFTPAELANLSPATAQIFLDTLHEAVETFLATNVVTNASSRSGQTIQKITTLENSILSQSGTSSTDKLKNFLSK